MAIEQRSLGLLTLVQYGGMFTTKSVLSGGFDVSSSLIACFLI